MEQSDHLADGIVQVDPPELVRPAILAGQVRPAQDKGVQHLRFVGQGLECGGLKEKLESRVKRTGAGVAIVKGDTVSILAVAALPAYQGIGPFPCSRICGIMGVPKRQIKIWRNL